jgi:transposase
MLKLINDEIDFSFVNELLEGSYCKRYGRPAKEPELMVRLLVLQRLYNLSDRRVIEEASLHLAYMYFLGINPEEELPHHSLLAKFRTQRLQDITIDDILSGIVQQCVEKGIVEGKQISIDSTHTEAKTFQATVERVMKRLANKMFTTIKEELGEIPSNIDQEIPDYREIVDHKEAKRTMKTYIDDTITKVENLMEEHELPQTKALVDNAKEIINDPKFMEQKGVHSLVDQEARVGHKSRTKRFFGYKTEFMMLTEAKLILSVTVGNGAYVDGTRFQRLLEIALKSGLTIEEVYGDKAYFKKNILDQINAIGANPYIPVSEMAYRIDDERFKYNKDSDEWFCERGNSTVKKSHKKRKNGKESLRYYFNRETCRDCPLRDTCISGKTVGKIMEVGINTPEFYEYSQEQKSDAFKEKYKARAGHEGKNGEMKQFHGLDRAIGYGLRSMSFQAKLTALAVNLKRIAKLLSSSNLARALFYIYILFKIRQNLFCEEILFRFAQNVTKKSLFFSSLGQVCVPVSPILLKQRLFGMPDVERDLSPRPVS